MKQPEDEPGDSKVAVDPENGLLATLGYWPYVRVSYHYAFSVEMGGGEYRRESTRPYTRQTYIKRVRQPIGADGDTDKLNPVLNELFDEMEKENEKRRVLKHAYAIVEIADSRVYQLT